jgi:hypothetical protein
MSSWLMRGLNCHSQDHAPLTRRGLERLVTSPALFTVLRPGYFFQNDAQLKLC